MKYAIDKEILAGRVHGLVTVPVRNLVVTVAAAGAGVGFGTVPIGDLPAGFLCLTLAKASFGFQTSDTDVIATFSGTWGIGSTPDADGTLSGTDVNIIDNGAGAGVAFGPAVARVVAPTTGRRAVANGALFLDNANGALELNLNVTVNAADITDAQSAPLTVNGFLAFHLGVMP